MGVSHPSALYKGCSEAARGDERREPALEKSQAEPHRGGYRRGPTYKERGLPHAYEKAQLLSELGFF
jgi:hypothetical protein